jgi:hypothetical protein
MGILGSLLGALLACYICNMCRKIGEKEAYRKKRKAEIPLAKKPEYVKNTKKQIIDDSTMMSERSLPSSTVIDQQKPITVKKQMVIPARKSILSPSKVINKENSPRMSPSNTAYVPGVTPRIHTKTIVYQNGKEHVTEHTNVPTSPPV